MPTREEIITLAASLFPGRPAPEIMEYLDLYGTEPHERERERIQYDILKLCKGSLDRLLSLIDLAKRDYRDIIMQAEYPPISEEEAKKIVDEIRASLLGGKPLPEK